MARIKVRNTITTRTAAEDAIARLNNIDMQLAMWDMDEANAIAVLREKHAELQRKGGRSGFEAEKSLLVKELEIWASEDSATWEKKTYETTFGKMGFRVSNPAVILMKKVAKSFNAALELLKSRMPEYVRNEPQIDKEKILYEEREKMLDIEKLAKCGLTVDQRDEFWIETNASKNLEEAAERLKAA